MKNSTKEKTMLDPDATLAEMHSTALGVLASEGEDDEIFCEAACRLAQMLIDLDGFLAAGGMMPRRWLVNLATAEALTSPKVPCSRCKTLRPVGTIHPVDGRLVCDICTKEASDETPR